MGLWEFFTPRLLKAPSYKGKDEIQTSHNPKIPFFESPRNKDGVTNRYPILPHLLPASCPRSVAEKQKNPISFAFLSDNLYFCHLMANRCLYIATPWKKSIV